jgi:hypothetical protein
MDGVGSVVPPGFGEFVFEEDDAAGGWPAVIAIRDRISPAIDAVGAHALLPP